MGRKRYHQEEDLTFPGQLAHLNPRSLGKGIDLNMIHLVRATSHLLRLLRLRIAWLTALLVRRIRHHQYLP